MLLQSPRDSRSGLAWLLCLCAVLLLLAATQTAHGQTQKPNEPPNLKQLLETSEANLTLLATRLEERGLQVQLLRDNLLEVEARLRVSAQSLTDLQAQLVEAEKSLAVLQTTLSEMQSSHDLLLKRYAELESSWKSYRDEMRGQIEAVKLERDRARVWTRILLGTTIAGGIATLVFVLR